MKRRQISRRKIDELDGPPCRKEIGRLRNNHDRVESGPDTPRGLNGQNTDATVKDSSGPTQRACCFKIYRKRSYERTNWPPEVNTIDIVFALGGLSLFVVDYSTDVKLAVDYITNGEYTLFILTVCFIAVPSFISGIISIIWYKMAYRSRYKETGYECTKPLLCCRRALPFLQLGRIAR